MKHLKLFFALFAMLALGIGNAWGAETLYKTALFGANYNSKKVSSYTDTWTATNDGFVVTVVNANNNNNGWAYIKMGRKNNVSVGTITTNAAIDKAISKVTLTIDALTASKINSITLKTSTSADGTYTSVGNFTSATGSQSVEISNPTANLFYKIEVDCASGSSNGLITISKVEYYAINDNTGNEEPAVKTLQSIKVTPKTVDYETGDEFKFDGTCTATYSVTKNGEPQDDETAVVTPTTVSTPDMSTAGTKEITVTYTEGDVTVTDKYEINVTENVVTPGEYKLLLNNVFFGTTAGTNVSSFPTSAKQDDITVTLNGSGTKTRTDAANVRMYSGNTLTFSVPVGYLITSITFTEPSSSTQWDGKITVNSGDYDETNKSWSGLAQDVVFTFGAQNRIAEAIVTYVADVKSTLTIETPQNGTISVKNGTTEVTSGTQLSAGTSLVVTPTPASGYLFESLIVDGIQVELSEGKYTFTMPENDVTISATFKANEKPAATLTLSKNGETELLPGNHKQDDVVTLPDFESDCSKTFVGWSENQNCNTEPEYKAGDSYQLKLEGNQTLYAVYADGEEGGVTTIKYSGSTTNMSGDNDAKTLGLDESVWTVVGEKGGASNNVGLNTNGEFRLYYHASGGNTLTITAPKTIATVVLSLKTNYDNAWVKVDGNIVEPIDGVYEINANTFVIGNANTSNVQVHILQIDITLAGNYSNFSTTCAAAPKAEVNSTEVTATAAGGNGKVEVTYENVNTEDLRVALFNDEECGVVFTAGWLTASIDADKNITYTVAENTTYAERNAYIQLTAPETTGATDPAVVVIPVTQAGKDKVFASLADLLANITPTTDATKVTVILTKEPIVDIYVSGNYRNGIFLNVPYQGTTKEIEIYSRDVPAEWVAGGSVSGTLTNCDWKVYNGIWELCPADWSELTYQEPKAVSTVVVSGAPTKTTYVDGEAFDPAGLTVTVNYNDATTEVNPTGVTFKVTPTTLVKGQTSVSVTATFNSVTSEAYTVNNLIVTDIQSMTILDFITSGGTRCYLEGIVSGLTEGNSMKYGNFDLTDASGTIYVYGCLNAAGESQKFADLGVKNGDKIKVIANESSLYNGKTQTKDVQYVSHKSAATIEVADIAMEVGDTHTISATVTPEGAPVTYAIKEGNCITLNVAEITATAAGTATIVATIGETEDYMGAEKEITVTVTAVDTRKKAVSPSSFTATSGELSPNDITYTSYQGGAANAPGTYNNAIRLYQISGTNTYGGYITLTAVKGCMIDQVEITTTDEYETTTVAYSVDDNVTLLGSASVAQLGKYSTPAGLNTESVNILNLGTTNKNRLEIASITVYYTGQPLADPELSWTSNAVELRVGEAFTAPTLNNPYNVTGITYRSDNELLAKVNETTGAVTLVPDATGTATITATFAGDATYKSAEVTCVITVNPKSEKVVILAQLEGQWYAMTGEYVSGKTNVLAAIPVEYINGTLYNVAEDDKASIEWQLAMNGNIATFKNKEGNYLTGGTSTDLTLKTDAFEWDYNGVNYLCNDGKRTFLYCENTKTNVYGFKNYAISNVGSVKNNSDGTTESYSSTPEVTAPVYATATIYTRDVTADNFGTICLPYGSSNYAGAEFYEVSSLVVGQGLWLDQLAAGATLEAGKPYIFKATANKIVVAYEGSAASSPAAGANGLTGTFTDIAANGVLVGNYIIANNKVWVANNQNTLPANRAYIANTVPTTEQPQLPGRRRVCMGENAATGLDQIVAPKGKAIKVIENNQLIIIRDGVKYNIQGQVIR